VPHPNLADPDFEPTDEDFAKLCKEAFKGIVARHDDELAKLRVKIDIEGTAALKKLEQLRTP